MSLAVVLSRGLVRPRRAAGHRRVPRRQRPARVQPGRAAGDRGQGGTRPRACGIAERELRLPATEVHGEFGAGGSAEGVRPLRPADRARHPRRHRAIAAGALGDARVRRRARADWRAAPDPRRAADRAVPRGATAAPSCCRRRARPRRRWCATRSSIRRAACWPCARTSRGALRWPHWRRPRQWPPRTRRRCPTSPTSAARTTRSERSPSPRPAPTAC